MRGSAYTTVSAGLLGEDVTYCDIERERESNAHGIPFHFMPSISVSSKSQKNITLRSLSMPHFFACESMFDISAMHSNHIMTIDPW